MIPASRGYDKCTYYPRANHLLNSFDDLHKATLVAHDMSRLYIELTYVRCCIHINAMREGERRANLRLSGVLYQRMFFRVESTISKAAVMSALCLKRR